MMCFFFEEKYFSCIHFYRVKLFFFSYVQRVNNLQKVLGITTVVNTSFGEEPWRWWRGSLGTIFVVNNAAFPTNRRQGKKRFPTKRKPTKAVRWEAWFCAMKQARTKKCPIREKNIPKIKVKSRKIREKLKHDRLQAAASELFSSPT